MQNLLLWLQLGLGIGKGDRDVDRSHHSIIAMFCTHATKFNHDMPRNTIGP